MIPRRHSLSGNQKEHERTGCARLHLCQPSLRDSAMFGRLPKVETLGYSRKSLRDENRAQECPRSEKSELRTAGFEFALGRLSSP
jgi:hypothetical protein